MLPQKEFEMYFMIYELGKDSHAEWLKQAEIARLLKEAKRDPSSRNQEAVLTILAVGTLVGLFVL